MKDLELIYKGRTYRVPNRWESMTSEQYLHLIRDLMRMGAGKISSGEVRIRYLCDVMGWNIHKFRNEDQIADLIAISEQLTFLFLINYPDNNSVLDGLDAKTRERCQRIDPFRLHHPIARVLRRLDYQYVPDFCFCAQLLPTITASGKEYHGYRIETDYGMITCSLSALQYIEARALIEQGQKALPLMAAILYYPDKEYDSQRAHAMAKDFAALDMNVLAAISLNFQAFNCYLFTKTPFSLLAKFKHKQERPITTDASEALYDLSKDGLGDARQIEQMNLLTYLKILRKKSIDAVRDLKSMDWDKLKISNEVGLPVSVIDQII